MPGHLQTGAVSAPPLPFHPVFYIPPQPTIFPSPPPPPRPSPAHAGDAPYVTDNHNFIVDLYFESPIADSAAASKAILDLEGVVDHGLFLGMVDVCIIAGRAVSVCVVVVVVVGRVGWGVGWGGSSAGAGAGAGAAESVCGRGVCCRVACGLLPACVQEEAGWQLRGAWAELSLGQ